MEVSMTTVSRSSSFRKRPLEERKSLDVELELLPSKHERAPSDGGDMDTTTPANTVQDEIEAHFQRSLAHAKGAPPPLHPSHSPNSNHSAEKHSRVTASPSTPTPAHEPESHKIILTLNNHAVTHSNQAMPPLTNGTSVPVKPVPQTASASFNNITHQNIRNMSPLNSPKTNSVYSLPMLSIPPGCVVNSESGTGGAILSPALPPQLLQQILTQQNLQILQDQQKQNQGFANKTSPTLVTKLPNLITSNQNLSPKALQIIDLTKTQLSGLPAQGQGSPKNFIFVSKDGTQVAPLATMATGQVGGALRVLTPPQSKPVNKSSATVVTATTTQPTPAVTSTFLSSPQLMGSGGGGFSPLMVPMIDPNTQQQVITGVPGNGNQQIVFLSAPPTLPTFQQQQQPVVLVNPTDLLTLQQVQSGGQSSAVNLLGPGFTTVQPNHSGGPGYILLSPRQTTNSFLPPLINIASTTGASPIITMTSHNNSPPPLKSSPPPLTKTTPSKRPRIPPLEAPLRRTSLDSLSPGGEDNEDVMMTPASVEDHFAKALGEQWSKLQTDDEFNGHSRSVQAAQT